jgi:hypothetical protein
MKLTSPNLKRIFGVKRTDQIPNTEFAKIVAKIDSTMSKIGKYKGQYYENGEQTLYYKCCKWNITVTIDDNNDEI